MPDRRRLSIVTWNVRYFSQGWGGLATHGRTLRAIAATLGRWTPPPDVIALQEVEARSLRSGWHRQSQLERFVAALRAWPAMARATGLYFPAHRYGPAALPLYTTGIALIVRDTLEILEHNAAAPHDVTHLRLPAFRGLKQRRVAGHARLRLRGGPAFSVYNTHLSLPAFLEGGPPHEIPRRMGHGTNQRREVDRLLALVGRDRPDPALLVGDFNAAPASPAYTDVVAAGWHDPTPASAHATGTAAFLASRMHIDHVFGSAAVRWPDRAVVVGSIDDPRFTRLSDHAPKFATFGL